MALADNLVGYWKFDESSGNASDEVNSNTMLNQASTPFAAGKINNGANLELDDSNYFTTGDNPTNLNITGDISFSFWIKPESVPPNNLDEFHVVTKFDSGDFISYRTVYRQVGGQLQLYGEYRNTDNTRFVRVSSPQDLGTGSWHHVVMTMQVADQIVLIYADDSVLTPTHDDSGTLPNSIQSSTVPVTIGAFGDVGLFFDGMIDEVGIWDRVLTSGEVTELWNGGDGLPYPFPAAAVVTRSLGGGATYYGGGLLNY